MLATTKDRMKANLQEQQLGIMNMNLLEEVDESSDQEKKKLEMEDSKNQQKLKNKNKELAKDKRKINKMQDRPDLYKTPQTLLELFKMKPSKAKGNRVFQMQLSQLNGELPIVQNSIN